MTSVERCWIAFDYGYLLPFLALLPIRLGRALAALRGQLYASLGRDWRQFSFDDQQLQARTRQAMSELMPGATFLEINRAVRRRYVMQSLEELEACWLACRDLSNLPVEYVGLDAVQCVFKTYGRAVFVTAHYASSILGTIYLGRLGVPILGMSSNVVEDPRVHPSIGRFYRKKYAAMAPYLHGGQILDRQGNSRRFARFLKDGGAVVIVGDLPPDPNESHLPIDIFSKTRELASGAERMARMVKVPLLSFVCEYTSKGYRVTFSSVDGRPYELLEKHISINPAGWWAADLLPLFPLVQEADC